MQIKSLTSGAFPRILGVVALLFYAIHATISIRAHESSNLLWLCNAGALLIGMGLILGRLEPLGIGLLWSMLGNTVWTMFVYFGATFHWSSLLTHAGGLIIGLMGARLMGLPARTWLWALLSLPVLQILSRLFTRKADNVNVAFRIQDGLGDRFDNYLTFWILVFLTCALCFIIFEFLLRKLFVKKVERI
ncbi:MAG: hypothetical protein K8S54_18715 [Spirochaetia bacterium]|nr:hypothetical protein [Spirochaetia bacterium]